LEGKVIRTLQTNVLDDQADYFGLIQKTPALDKGDESPAGYPYGISSLIDKLEVFEVGDVVRFQLTAGRGGNGNRHAVNLASAKRYVRARIESIKGQVKFFNFLHD
jgi:hypothetical protein